MKYFLILFVFAVFGFSMAMSADEVYGLWIPKSPEKLLEQSETVFVGTVTMVNELEFERSNTMYIEENGVQRIEVENYTQTLDEYTVNIEEFLKNPQESNTITMLEATVGGVPGRSVSIGGFELGDRVLFFVPNIDGTNQYSPESFEIPKQCDAKSVLDQSRVFLFNDFKMMQDGVEKNDNFVANKPIEFVYHMDLDTLNGSSFDVDINIRKITNNDWNTVFDKQIHTEIKQCEWATIASWEFIPTGGRHSMQMHTSEGDGTGGGTVSGGFTVKEFDFPLKQLISGIPVDKIQCNDDLVLLTKHRNSPACVTLNTKSKLMERGWVEPLGNIIKQRTVSPEPPLMSKSTLQLHDAKKLLESAYYENVNLGPLKINDVILGFGIENNTLVMDVKYRYSTSSEMDIVKKKIRDIVGEEILLEYIPYKPPADVIQKAMPYHWNEYLHKHNIEFVPADTGYGNNDDGIGNGNLVCSPLVDKNGTNFYIVSPVNEEPFEIIDTYVVEEKPQFCKKTWKTDVLLEEQNRITSLWLKIGQGKISK